MTRLVLGSASPARLNLLRQAGLAPEVVVSGVDESGVTAPDPASLALELARLKAQAVAATVTDALVIGCDSLLDFEGSPYGKPADLSRSGRFGSAPTSGNAEMNAHSERP